MIPAMIVHRRHRHRRRSGGTGLGLSRLGKAGLASVVLEKGALVNTILHFPTNMVLHHPGLLEIGGSRSGHALRQAHAREALRYYRRVVDTYQLDIQLGEE